MASSNKDNTIEYDKNIYKKPEKPKNHLAARVNKFQEKVNQSRTPQKLQINSIHDHHELSPNLLEKIKSLHQLIKDNGQQGDYAVQITFGELIPVYGAANVGQLIEILSLARQHGFINYAIDENLQQDRDEEVYIRLIKTPF